MHQPYSYPGPRSATSLLQYLCYLIYSINITNYLYCFLVLYLIIFIVFSPFFIILFIRILIFLIVLLLIFFPTQTTPRTILNCCLFCSYSCCTIIYIILCCTSFKIPHTIICFVFSFMINLW